MIFVFGSNRAGRHGKGAALFAAKNYGAQPGVGEGPTGKAYALPTKDYDLRPLPLEAIEIGVQSFFEYARANPAKSFALTPIGCGLAGNKKNDIWEILRRNGMPGNVYLTSSWVLG